MPDYSRYTLTPENQRYLASILGQPQPVSAWSTKTGGPVTPRAREDVALSEAQRFDTNNRSMASHNRLVNVGRLASIAPFGVAAGAALAGGSGVAAAAPAVGTGATSAPTAGATTGIMSRMGSILGSKALEGGVNAGLTLYGQKSQNKANDQARKDVLAAQAKEIELEEKRLALEASNANLDREDARALNAAIQALEAKKFALQQEQTAFERSVYERGEANMAPYRDVQGKALQRMSSILGL